jgi:hypothetical protein
MCVYVGVCAHVFVVSICLATTSPEAPSFWQELPTQGCRNPGFEFSKPEVTRGYLESQVILTKNLNLEVFFVLVLPRTSRCTAGSKDLNVALLNDFISKYFKITSFPYK